MKDRLNLQKLVLAIDLMQRKNTITKNLHFYSSQENIVKFLKQLFSGMKCIIFIVLIVLNDELFSNVWLEDCCSARNSRTHCDASRLVTFTAESLTRTWICFVTRTFKYWFTHELSKASVFFSKIQWMFKIWMLWPLDFTQK